MFEFALTIEHNYEGLFERYPINTYTRIKIDADIFEKVIENFICEKSYFPEINEWGNCIDSSGITILPIDSLPNFLDAIKFTRSQDYWNLYQLEPLEELTQTAIIDNKNIIIFGY